MNQRPALSKFCFVFPHCESSFFTFANENKGDCNKFADIRASAESGAADVALPTRRAVGGDGQGWGNGAGAGRSFYLHPYWRLHRASGQEMNGGSGSNSPIEKSVPGVDLPSRELVLGTVDLQSHCPIAAERIRRTQVVCCMAHELYRKASTTALQQRIRRRH